MPDAIPEDISRHRHGTPVRTLTAGLNAWVAAALMPWWYLEEPTGVQTFLHALPAAGLVLGVVALSRAKNAGRNALVAGLVALFPASIGLAVATREASIYAEMPTVALLYSVLSLWVFVGVATTEARAHQFSPTAASPPLAVWSSFNLRTVVVVIAALCTVVVAPRWPSEAEREAAWLQAHTEGGLLSTACATALALGVLLIVMGPESLTPTRPTRVPLRQRLLPPLFAAVVGAAVYAVIASGS